MRPVSGVRSRTWTWRLRYPPPCLSCWPRAFSLPASSILTPLAQQSGSDVDEECEHATHTAHAWGCAGCRGYRGSRRATQKGGGWGLAPMPADLSPFPAGDGSSTGQPGDPGQSCSPRSQVPTLTTQQIQASSLSARGMARVEPGGEAAPHL